MNKDISIILESPLALNTSRSTESTESLDYIPGSALRGFTAGEYLLGTEENKPDGDFKSIFLEELVSFGNLYPFGGLPLPFTAVTCKRWKGFTEKQTEEQTEEQSTTKHGVNDQLVPLGIRWVVSQENKGDLEKLKPINKKLDELRFCKKCKEDDIYTLEPINGFYFKDKNGKYHTISTGKAILTRTGINRVTGNVEHGILYNIEVLETSSSADRNHKIEYRGSLKYTENSSDTLAPKVESFLHENKNIRLGVARSRGLGKAKITSLQTTSLTNFNDYAARLKKLNQLLHDFAKTLDADLYRNHFQKRFFISLDLLSDVILYDKYLRNKVRVTPEDLEKFIPRAVAGITLFGGISRTRQIGGWNPALGMPKPDELAIKKGSVFLFSLEGSEPDEQTLKQLYELEQAGLGERKSEGYGRIEFSNDFHSKFGFQLK